MTTIGGAGEFELLERIKPYLAAQSGRDDAALIEEQEETDEDVTDIIGDVENEEEA